MGWPKTRTGKIVLWASIVYGAFWLAFSLSSGLNAAVLAVPYLGTALNVFFAFYVAAVLFWGLTWLLRN